MNKAAAMREQFEALLAQQNGYVEHFVILMYGPVSVGLNVNVCQCDRCRHNFKHILNDAVKCAPCLPNQLNS